MPALGAIDLGQTPIIRAAGSCLNATSGLGETSHELAHVMMAGMASPRRAGGDPVHPGHFLDTHFIKPLGLTQVALADALGVSRRRVNELVRGRRGVTPDTALRLAAYFRTDPEFWMELQLAWDIHRTRRARKT